MRLNTSTVKAAIGLHFDDELIILFKRPDGRCEFKGIALLTVHGCEKKVNFRFVLNKNK
jgi:hypothetical protein